MRSTFFPQEFLSKYKQLLGDEWPSFFEAIKRKQPKSIAEFFHPSTQSHLRPSPHSGEIVSKKCKINEQPLPSMSYHNPLSDYPDILASGVIHQALPTCYGYDTTNNTKLSVDGASLQKILDLLSNQPIHDAITNDCRLLCGGDAFFQRDGSNNKTVCSCNHCCW